MNRCTLLLCFVLFAGISSISEASAVKRSDDQSPLESLVQQQAATIQRLDTKVTAQENQVAALSHKAVGFTVQFSADPIDNVGTHGTLKFDRVISNIGGGYNTETGTFTAPVSGVYVIFLRGMSRDDRTGLQLAIHKTDVLLGKIYTQGHGDPADQGANEVIVHIQAGESIWVSHDAYDTGLRGSWWTVFTGFLLRAD